MRLGNVATGSDFFNRTKELREIWKILQDNHLVMRGPRRLGKTSILYKLMEEAPDHGYEVLLMDVGGLSSPQQFVRCLREQITNSTHKKLQKHGLKKGLEKIKIIKLTTPVVGGELELKDEEAASWQVEGDRILQALFEGQFLILMDEFPVMLEEMLRQPASPDADSPNPVRSFLGWLRKWRTNPAWKSRFVFTGSIGLHYLLVQHDLIAEMNDCAEFILGPFKRKHARELLELVAEKEGYRVNEDVAELMCDKIGWLSPFMLNLLLHEALSAAEDRLLEEPPTVDPEGPRKANPCLNQQDVEYAYERLLGMHSRFIHWENRLKKRLPAQEYQCAKDILTHLAKAEEGLSLSQLSLRLYSSIQDPDKREALIQQQVIHLMEEGYLSDPDAEGRLHFLSFILKEWWRRNHG